ncbi:MAG: type IV pilus modification PilV family protein [Thermoguttaceae bacterium]
MITSGFAPSRRRFHPRRPFGFSMVEAMVAITIMGIAGSAMLCGVFGAMQTTDDNLQQALALGMAQQLMDEIVGNRYHAVGANGYEYPLSASSWERNGAGRERYNDIDDFNGLRVSPPEDVYGVPVGTGDDVGGLRHPNFRVVHDYFRNWRQEVDVFYVDPADLSRKLSAGNTSDYRAVEVRIVRDDPDTDPRVLARLRQVVSYVAPL